MELIQPLISTRIQLIIGTEPKESIEDVIFTIKSSDEKILDTSIHLVSIKDLINVSNKDNAIGIVINKIIDKSFFKNNGIDLDKFDVAIFFSFDSLNLVDSCYIFDFDKGSIQLKIFDLNGKLLIDKTIKEQHSLPIDKPKIHYLFFDTETTGLPKNWKAPVTDFNNWPRLVQLAFLCYDQNGNKISEGDYIIKPDGFTIPSEASKIHGITTEIAQNIGHSISSVLSQFNLLLGQSNYLVAHNMSFDEKIVGSELLRNEMQNSISSKNKICTMESATSYCAINGPYGYKWPKLSELHYKLFDSNFDEAHNAAIDVNATAKCFWELKRRRVI